MQNLTSFPLFVTFSETTAQELQPFFASLTDGISEFTVDSLLIHQKIYRYEAAWLPGREGHACIVKGTDTAGGFFFIPEIIPTEKEIAGIFKALPGFYWKNLSARQYTQLSATLPADRYRIEFDRGNSDYVYLRQSLADLPGKQFHKKKNLANAFCSLYQPEVKPLDATSLPQTIADAFDILTAWYEAWKSAHPDDANDYVPCRTALERIKTGRQCGIILYADGKPAGFSLGEKSADNTCFFVHFEKCIPGCKGIYQYINRAMAASLPAHIQYLNREQDLNDPGLRQAKETYRPTHLVEKYTLRFPG